MVKRKKILNPKTNRMVYADGAVGRLIKKDCRNCTRFKSLRETSPIRGTDRYEQYEGYYYFIWEWIKYMKRKFRREACFFDTRGITDADFAIGPIIIRTTTEKSAKNPMSFYPGFLDELDRCEKRFMITFAVLVEEDDDENHLNGVIFDVENRRFYLYEPNGYAVMSMYDYVSLGKEIRKQLKRIPELKRYRYVPPIDFCPRDGPEPIEGENPFQEAREGQEEGLCTVWSMLFLHEQLLNPKRSPKQILNRLMSKTPDELSARVREYQSFLVRLYDEERCPPEKIYNKHTERCVLRDGRIGRKLYRPKRLEKVPWAE